jgi:osmotically-inducible protein OsmY
MNTQPTTHCTKEDHPAHHFAPVALAAEPERQTEGAFSALPPREVRRFDRPRLLIVGEVHHTRRIRRSLRNLALELKEVADLREAVDGQLVPGTVGLVLAAPLRGIVPEHAVSLALKRSRGARLHVFAIVPEGFPDSRCAWLYRRGAAAVLKWSTDAEQLPALIEGALGASPASPGEPGGDRSLARMVRSRLRAARRLDDSVRLTVTRGAVRLAGRVRALWKRRYLESRLSRMPGVLAVDASGLEVERSALSDGEVAAAVRELLRGASSIEERSLAVSVHDGHVVLQGTVLGREEFLHARELVSRVEGARSVTDRTLEAPRRKRRETSLARRLRRAVLDRLSAVRGVHVAVLGETAILRGRVPLRSTKSAAERLVNDDPAVARVVNKLHVV